MPNRKKPNTLFLPARIKRLMQKDEEVGKLSATVPVIAARALEQFLEELITKTALVTSSLQAKTLTPEHIRQYIYSDPRLSFLHDLANRMGTGPTNNTHRSYSTSSATSTPTMTTNRSPFQQQLSVSYQEPLPTTSSSSTSTTSSSNLLYRNQQLSRSYSNSYYTKMKTKKRSFDLVDNAEDDDDDDDDDDDEQPMTSNHPTT